MSGRTVRAAASIVALALIAVLTSTGAGAVRANPQQPDVIVAARGDRNTYFPTIARLASGELVVVYYDNTMHMSQTGRIALVRSTDDGRTWSAPRVVLDTPLDDRDPQIVQTRAGTLLLSYFAYDWSRTPARVMGTFVARSEDNGATWTSPVQVGTAITGAASSAKITELENGDLLIPLYGTVPGTGAQRATVVRSTDDGRTWPPGGEVTIALAPPIDFQEPAVANLGGGHLFAMLRTGRSDNFAYEVDSSDGGQTWTAPRKTDMQAQASDLLVLPGGVVLHTWGDVSRTFAAGRPVVARLKLPGRDWSAAAPILLYAGTQACSDASYPSSVLLGDGRILTVYYDSCAGYIGGTYSTLATFPQPSPSPGAAPAVAATPALPAAPQTGGGGMARSGSWPWAALLIAILFGVGGLARRARPGRHILEGMSG